MRREHPRRRGPQHEPSRPDGGSREIGEIQRSERPGRWPAHERSREGEARLRLGAEPEAILLDEVPHQTVLARPDRRAHARLQRHGLPRRHRLGERRPQPVVADDAIVVGEEPVVREAEGRIAVRIPDRAARVGERDRDRAEPARSERDLSGRLNARSIPRRLGLGGEPQPHRLEGVRAGHEDSDDRRERHHGPHARVPSAAPPPLQLADEQQGRGDRNQAGAREGQQDGFRDPHRRDEAHGGGGPAAADAGGREQSEQEREHDLQIHGRDRRVLKRAARANLPTDHREAGPERAERADHDADAEVFEHCQRRGHDTRQARGHHQAPRPRRRRHRARRHQIHAERHAEAADHVQRVDARFRRGRR